MEKKFKKFKKRSLITDHHKHNNEKNLKYWENYHKKQEMSKCWWENGTNRLALHRTANKPSISC